jgi:hypothetical protein
MTHPAIPQPLRINLILLHEFATARKLIGRRFPTHVEDLVLRPDVALGCFVAVQAPAHVKSLGFPGERHLVNAAMTGRAADAFLHVDAVIEENEIWQLIHPVPLQRLIGGQALAHGREHGRVGPNLRMAAHASVSWGNSRERTLLDRVVAVSAVNPQARDVMLMTEGHLLLARHVLIGRVRRQINSINQPPEREEPQHPASQRRSRDAIAALSKNLGHGSRPNEVPYDSVKDLVHR